MSNSKPATAAQVRAYFNDPKSGAARQAKVVKRAEAIGVKNASVVAVKCLVAGQARGRLSPAVIAEYNATHSGAKYVTGNSNESTKARKDARVALRQASRDAGFPVGPKGPIPKAFLATLKK